MHLSYGRQWVRRLSGRRWRWREWGQTGCSASTVLAGSEVGGINFGLAAGMNSLPVDRKLSVCWHVGLAHIGLATFDWRPTGPMFDRAARSRCWRIREPGCDGDVVASQYRLTQTRSWVTGTCRGKPQAVGPERIDTRGRCRAHIESRGHHDAVSASGRGNTNPERSGVTGARAGTCVVQREVRTLARLERYNSDWIGAAVDDRNMQRPTAVTQQLHPRITHQSAGSERRIDEGQVQVLVKRPLSAVPDVLE